MKLQPLILIISAATLATQTQSNAGTVSGGAFIEDFTSIDSADLGATTGIWNSVAGRAQSAAFADGNASRPISFGDGSDGALDSSSGYVFDTDTHPNGYSFKSVNISGGTITVQGSSPLVIRSLGAVTITPTLPAHTGASRHGANATLNVGTSPTVGAVSTCSAQGGAGGAATAAAGSNGGNALQSTGAIEAGRNGAGQTGANSNLIDASVSLTGPASNDFDTASNFVCGTSGAGGGGYSTGAVQFASGASGGAGGGRIRITAIGNLTVSAVEAIGGNGGNGVTVGGPCSGNGAGGNGGVVWLQTLSTLAGPAPDVSAGTGGTSACFAGSGGGLAGFTRGDSAPGSRPAWAVGDFDTDLVPASTQSVIQSRGQDLGTLNAGFTSAPTITQTLNGGQISVTYAASTDNINYTSFVADPLTFSNQGYRYLKFRIAITSAGIAATSPFVSRIALSFQDLGPKEIEMDLAAGCGITQREGKDQPISRNDPRGFAFWALLWIVGYLVLSRRSPLSEHHY